MSWRTLMRAEKSPGEKNQEPTKPPTIRTKPIEQDQESHHGGAFVPFVGESEGSQNLTTGESLPFRIHDKVNYKVPVIDKEPFQYHWQEHTGVILAVSAFAEMVLIQPEDEPGEPWRWIWWGMWRR